MTRPARRSRAPRQRPAETTTAGGGGPGEVRLIGHEATVRRMADALTEAAGDAAGPVRYRPCRDGDGIRAYLTVAVQPEHDGAL